MADYRIPLALPFVDVVIEPTDDPYSVRITLPPAALGTAILPRYLFSEKVNEHTAVAADDGPSPPPIPPPGDIYRELEAMGARARIAASAPKQSAPKHPEVVQRVARFLAMKEVLQGMERGFTEEEREGIMADVFLPWVRHTDLAREIVEAMKHQPDLPR